MSDRLGFAALAIALAENTRSAAIYVDASGAIRSWNRGAEMLFGRTAGDAVGRLVDIIVPEALRAAHWSGFNRAVRSSWRGSASWDPIEALHRSGERVTLEVFLLPVEGTDDRLRGVLAIFRPRSNSAETAG